MQKLIFILCLSLLWKCESPKQKTSVNQTAIVENTVVPKKSTNLTQTFKKYWFDGTAELSSFDLEQVRYGEIRKGRAVIVFVAEDFSKTKFVKLDDPDEHPEDKVKVLKFNLNKRFKTGIYDYALMQSVFTPIDQINHPNTLRVTTSNIEWCGQFLTRAELKNDQYEVKYNSYFEGEENTFLSLEKNILEDEIWNQIRISPDKLPQGVFDIIPGILTQELVHHPLKIEQASGTVISNGNTSIYELEYTSILRKLIIKFESAFPHKILGWEETFETVEGWGMESKLMTTKATRIADTKTDYWNKKYLKDEVLRKESLGIND